MLEQAADFHQKHLDRVSRSFAFGISRLELPLRVSVGLSYLLCRVLDTVEDSSWPSGDAQIESFKKFDSFLLARPNGPSKQDIDLWQSSFPAGIPDAEVALLKESHRLFEELHQLSDEEYRAVTEPVKSMSAGMQYFAHVSRKRGELRISSLR
ncbi:MAG: squalene/phytoene synthase family protein, partial [Bdellovibrionota bacterium]